MGTAQWSVLVQSNGMSTLLLGHQRAAVVNVGQTCRSHRLLAVPRLRSLALLTTVGACTGRVLLEASGRCAEPRRQLVQHQVAGGARDEHAAHVHDHLLCHKRGSRAWGEGERGRMGMRRKGLWGSTAGKQGAACSSGSSSNHLDACAGICGVDACTCQGKRQPCSQEQPREREALA